ncbi:dihydroorotase [Pygmaiobacter massiliensis]|uniref:dihydroorotase n=1 Tax=Pygmaiobacter massiliensis TaxID=1917873 RepID=UPI000C7D97AF|nr:dihydroorotase [Pygmaiobacter massiliensis]
MKLRGNIWLGHGFANGELTVDKGRIAGIGVCVSDSDGGSVFKLNNCFIIPGLADVHVHLRDPGFSMKETMFTGTAAAARGGYTAVCSMPNLNPPPDTPEHLQLQLDKIKRDACVKVYPVGTITKGQQGSGELSEMEALAPNVIGFSDDGRGVQSEALMEEAMHRAAALGKPIIAHCEANELLHGGYIHDGAYAKAHGHKGISSESEWKQVERDLALAKRTGCQYHVCHISTKESVELIRKAKAEGVRVSCETAPHYLLLTEEDLQEDGRFKMNPPLRTKADREALVAGLVDGTIDMVATDHAPHTAGEKARGLAGSAMGIVGLETAFPLLYTYLVKPGILPMERLIDAMSTAPRRIFGLPGGMAEGDAADIAVFDLDCEYKIDPQEFVSMGQATPFAGWQVNGRTVMTIVEGKIKWQNNSIVK